MWYTASLLFRGKWDADDTEVYWHETVRLIRAESPEQARELAQELGAVFNTARKDPGAGQWQFCHVAHVYALEAFKPEQFLELFSYCIPESQMRALLLPPGTGPALSRVSSGPPLAASQIVAAMDCTPDKLRH